MIAIIFFLLLGLPPFPEPIPPMPVPPVHVLFMPLVATQGAGFDCVQPDVDCDDFPNWNAAQLAYQFCMVQGLGDPYGLDADADNFACEHLENPWL